MSTGPDEELLEELFKADDDGEVGYVRYLCELVLQKHPDHWRTLLCHASNLTALAQYELAAEALDRADACIPAKQRYLLYYGRGHLAEARGLFADAEALFLQAHQGQPAEATGLILAGSAAFRDGRIGRAEELARKAIECPRGCIDEAYFNLGGYLLSQKRYSEARECYQKAIELDPDYDEAYQRLADVNRTLLHRYEREGN